MENYIKLLSIGEGIFPKDKIKTKIDLKNSNAVFSTESATKVYPSKKEYGVNSINIELENSNLEFLNDELILYKDSKLLSFLKIKADKSSTFFYADILSDGRSAENFDFTSMRAKNSFYIDKDIEYLEKFDVKGFELKNYIFDNSSTNKLFAKIYIKSLDNQNFLEYLRNNEFTSFTLSSKQNMIVGVISSENMARLKDTVNKLWGLYRSFLGKKEMNLGKQ